MSASDDVCAICLDPLFGRVWGLQESGRGLLTEEEVKTFAGTTCTPVSRTAKANEIKEIWWCRHQFHRSCWINLCQKTEGQVACPLCRHFTQIGRICTNPEEVHLKVCGSKENADETSKLMAWSSVLCYILTGMKSYKAQAILLTGKRTIDSVSGLVAAFKPFRQPYSLLIARVIAELMGDVSQLCAGREKERSALEEATSSNLASKVLFRDDKILRSLVAAMITEGHTGTVDVTTWMRALTDLFAHEPAEQLAEAVRFSVTERKKEVEYEVLWKCSHCNKRSDTSFETPIFLKACSRCYKTFYCSKACQKKHWKAGHKHHCKLLQ